MIKPEEWADGESLLFYGIMKGGFICKGFCIFQIILLGNLFDRGTAKFSFLVPGYKICFLTQ
jgi:hypothetical protein